MQNQPSSTVSRAATLFVFLPLWACSHQGGSDRERSEVDPASAEVEDRKGQATAFEEGLAELKTTLDLTDGQLERVRPIMQVAFEARRSILNRFGIAFPVESGPETNLGMLDARQLRKELAKVEAKTAAQLDDILTDEQVEAYRQLQENKKQAMRERILGGR